MLTGQENTTPGIAAPVFNDNVSGGDGSAAAADKASFRDTSVRPQAYVPHHLVGGARHPGVIVETPGSWER
ncbi:hypothetical protein [Leptolyngbya sp. 7M]|uniref:hypothetical protein n=1 Tax=Leptolyngbya sp. 7M TaxID=2812896 RepID=UPI001B8C4A6B|nr:hypothetical protein [Leptolyngbya sp. 7M]QYO62570.1 hypothetical protein JVX88_21220 [Leptolyngbya sp. 7M]